MASFKVSVQRGRQIQLDWMDNVAISNASHRKHSWDVKSNQHITLVLYSAKIALALPNWVWTLDCQLRWHHFAGVTRNHMLQENFTTFCLVFGYNIFWLVLKIKTMWIGSVNNRNWSQSTLFSQCDFHSYGHNFYTSHAVAHTVTVCFVFI